MYLATPPITEVVCGFIFEPLPLDMLDVGLFWDSVRAEYPRKSIQPAIVDPGTFHFGVVPQRAWLSSTNDELLMQVQADRFYVNWRKGQNAYPRFSDHGQEPGLGTIALRQFEVFKGFVARHIQQDISLTALELSKIDILKAGHDYDGLSDLAQLLTVLGPQRPPDERTRQTRIRIQDQHTNLSTITEIVVAEGSARIETRAHFTPEADLRGAFYRANAELNATFFALFDESLLQRRFGGGLSA